MPSSFNSRFAISKQLRSVLKEAMVRGTWAATAGNPPFGLPARGKIAHVFVLVVTSLSTVCCTPSARLANETATGGTVIYPYVEEQDVLTSPARRDALRLLDGKCPTGYRISREGQIAQVDKSVDRAWMGQVSRDGQPNREKRWAIQFTCK